MMDVRSVLPGATRLGSFQIGGCDVGFSKKTVPQASDMCACGHAYDAHEHYRKGTECAICDIRSCSAFSLATVPAYSNIP